MSQLGTSNLFLYAYDAWLLFQHDYLSSKSKLRSSQVITSQVFAMAFE